MERKKYIRIRIILISLALLICGSSRSEYSERIYSAYITGDMNEWENVINEIEEQETLTIREKKELLEYYYGYVGFLLGEGKNSGAKKYITKADDLIYRLENSGSSDAMVLACKGIFLGYKMNLSRIKTPVLGPMCMKYINKAYETDPENIQAIADKGHMLYNAPSLFGGDKKEGIIYLERAVKKLEDTGTAKGNWMYLNILTGLAHYKNSMGDRQGAIDTYEKIIAFEPDYVWVRDELYPELQK